MSPFVPYPFFSTHGLGCCILTMLLSSITFHLLKTSKSLVQIFFLRSDLLSLSVYIYFWGSLWHLKITKSPPLILTLAIGNPALVPALPPTLANGTVTLLVFWASASPLLTALLKNNQLLRPIHSNSLKAL